MVAGFYMPPGKISWPIVLVFTIEDLYKPVLIYGFFAGMETIKKIV